MGWLTKREKERAWNRLLRRHGNEVQISALLVHMTSQWESQAESAEIAGLHWLARITRRALSAVRRKVFITHSEVDVFLKRHIAEHRKGESE